MKIPKYNITNTLLKNITEIQQLYGKLEGMIIPQNLLLDFTTKNLIQSSYSSNKIEGNPLSHLEVTNLLLDARVPVSRDEKEVRNYFDILQTLGKTSQKKFTIESILEIHNALMHGVNNEIAGKIRNSSVVVGYRDQNDRIKVKHNPPKHTELEIRKELIELVDWVNLAEDLPLLKTGIYHHEFVYIHPFEDGNGRVCRLTTAELFLRYNYQINRYFVLDDYYDLDRDTYSNKLHSADSGDKTEWLEYFSEGIMYSLQSSLSKIQRGISTTKISNRPSPKELEVYEIVQNRKEVKTSEIAIELKVSRQQAFKLLNGLVVKGYIEAIGENKSRYYIIKT